MQSGQSMPMCFMPVPYYGYNNLYQFPQYPQQSMYGVYGPQAPQGVTVPQAPQVPLTPSPSPPPCRPDKGIEWAGREEYSLSEEEDEEDESENEENRDSDSEDKKESTKYKEKVKLAMELCKIEPPKMKQNPSSLMLSQKEKLKTVFPVDNTVDEHFKRAWESLTGNDTFSDTFSTEGPSKPAKGDPVFKSVLMNKHFKKWYGMAGEVKDTKSERRWPVYDWKIDDDFVNVFGGKAPEKRSTTSKAMVEVGRMIAVLNQSALFVKASNKIIEDFDRFVTEDGKQHWSVLKEFMEVRNKSMDDLISVGTNLQLNLLVARREEALKADLSKHESNVLKFAPPVDQHGRLFTGKLEEFKEWKGKREQTQVVTDLLKSSSRKRNNPEKKFEGDSNKKRRFNDDKFQSFRGKGNRYKGKRDGGNKDSKFFTSRRQGGDNSKTSSEEHN